MPQAAERRPSYQPPAAYAPPPVAREGHIAAPITDPPSSGHSSPRNSAPPIDHAEQERQRLAALARQDALEAERAEGDCRRQYGARFSTITRSGSGYVCQTCDPGFVAKGGQCSPTAEQAAILCRQQYGKSFVRVIRNGDIYSCHHCSSGYVPSGGQCVPTPQLATANCRQQFGGQFLRLVKSGNGYQCQYCNPGSVPRGGQCVSTAVQRPQRVHPQVYQQANPGIDPAAAAMIGRMIGGAIQGGRGHYAPRHYAPSGGHRSGGVIRGGRH